MVTLAFAQMVVLRVPRHKLGGGSDGIYLNFKPMLRSAAPSRPRRHAARSTTSRWLLLALVYVVPARCCCARASATRSPASASTSSACARWASAPIGYKLAASSLAGALAGLAGFLFAVKDGFVNPELLSWHQSGARAADGDPRRHRAACAARSSAPSRSSLLKELFQSEALFGALAQALAAAAGPAIIVLRGAAAARASRGIAGAAAGSVPRRRSRAHGELSAARCCATRASTRRFGGLAAVNASRSTLARGERPRGDRHQRRRQVDADQHAVGRAAAASAGTRRARGTRRHALAAAERARARGLGRSYQRTNDLPAASPCSRTAGSPRRRARQHALRAGWRARRAARATSTRARARARARRPRGTRATASPARSQPRRAAPARDRDVPRDRRRACCCSTSRSPAWAPRRRERMLDAARDAQATATRSCWSSTTWTRCSASPTASR